MPSSKKEVKTIIHEVNPFKQRYDWDCGVSCVIMLLDDEQRRHFLDNFDNICEEEGFGHSTWTIDLCYLLKRFGIKHELYTTMIGVNEVHRNKNYYQNIFDKDRSRVEEKFKMASTHDIPVFEEQISMGRIMDHLVHNGPVILLVDASLLVCDHCNHNKLMAEFRRCFGSSYRGHYILLTGVRGGSVCYREPARGRSARRGRCCRVAARKLHAAAAACGTDDDCILVYR